MSLEFVEKNFALILKNANLIFQLNKSNALEKCNLMDSELRVASVELNTLEKNHNNEYETKKIYLGQLVKQVADFEKEKSKKKASREKYKEKLINLRSKKKHLMKTMKSIEEEIQNNNDIMKLKCLFTGQAHQQRKNRIKRNLDRGIRFFIYKLDSCFYLFDTIY
jgi:hypothetical protein